MRDHQAFTQAEVLAEYETDNRSITVEITGCGKCPNLGNTYDQHDCCSLVYDCTKDRSLWHIKDKHIIQDWCPLLPEVKE